MGEQRRQRYHQEQERERQREQDEQRPLPPLLQLPEELRIAIFKICLIADSPIQWPDKHVTAGLSPALLRTCKMIHTEATPLLYKQNTLACQHPSDCNMFGWAHSPIYSKMISSLALNIRDQDTRLWTAYLGSTYEFRSLTHDFPALANLNITYRSRYWTLMDGTVQDKLKNWMRDPRLKEMCQILKKTTAKEPRDDRAEAQTEEAMEDQAEQQADEQTEEQTEGQFKVRILVVLRLPTPDLRQLPQLPQAMEKLTFNHDTSEARMGHMRMGRADVTLALTPLMPAQ